MFLSLKEPDEKRIHVCFTQHCPCLCFGVCSFINHTSVSISVRCSRPCLKRQLIDLLAEGYDPEHLDIAQPAVNVEDW